VNDEEDTTDQPPADKAALRAWARRRRDGLDWPALSEALIGRLAALPELAGAGDVLIYLAMPGEADVEALAERSPAKRWHVPRCAPERRLAVHRYVPGETALRRGPFGIREPDPQREPEADPAALDLVIVPALLLSEGGDRLGYGGGYYDRFLPRLRPGCLRVGAQPEAAVVPELPRDPWDAPLDVVVTERRVLRRRAGL
jgi:5-formyltetrahydrofolate cyclo-ligase